MRTVRSQETFRNAAAKPAQSSQRDPLLLGTLARAPLCALDMLWHCYSQRQMEKGRGTRQAWEH